MKRMRIIVTTIGLLGLAGFTLAFICGVWLSGLIPSTIEMPLAEAEGLAVDDAGRIYVASEAYARLQAYDSSGQFLWGAYLGPKPSPGIDADGGRIEVATSRDFMVFSTGGRLLRKEPSRGRDPDSGDSMARDGKGNVYRIEHPSIWPQVVKRTATGDESAIVSPRFLLWVFSGPFPAWLIGAICAMALKVMSRFGSQQSRGPQEGTSTDP